MADKNVRPTMDVVGSAHPRGRSNGKHIISSGRRTDRSILGEFSEPRRQLYATRRVLAGASKTRTQFRPAALAIEAGVGSADESGRIVEGLGGAVGGDAGADRDRERDIAGDNVLALTMLQILLAMRWAVAVSVLGRTRANSSPLMRAANPAPGGGCENAPMAMIAASPAGWPWVSLIALNPSTSIITSESGASLRCGIAAPGTARNGCGWRVK